MSKIINHIDPFLGDIKLKEVARVSVSSLHEYVTYYIIESEKHKSRRLQNGIWYKDVDGKMNWMNNHQIETVSRIYDKLTRID